MDQAVQTIDGDVEEVISEIQQAADKLSGGEVTPVGIREFAATIVTEFGKLRAALEDLNTDGGTDVTQFASITNQLSNIQTTLTAVQNAQTSLDGRVTALENAAKAATTAPPPATTAPPPATGATS